jgi:hypothetical protein
MGWTAGVLFSVGESDFLYSTLSRPALELTQPPIQWVQGVLSPGVKRQEREADHSPPCSVKVENNGTMPALPYTLFSWRFA